MLQELVRVKINFRSLFFFYYKKMNSLSKITYKMKKTGIIEKLGNTRPKKRVYNKIWDIKIEKMPK